MSQPVYLAANPVEAEIVKDYLAAHGIKATIRGVHAWGAVGDIPMAEAYPRLYLDNERQRDAARALIRQYESRIEGPAWTCAKCGEASPGTLVVCWNCGQPRAAS
jgi:hypothetical protein